MLLFSPSLLPPFSTLRPDKSGYDAMRCDAICRCIITLLFAGLGVWCKVCLGFQTPESRALASAPGIFHCDAPTTLPRCGAHGRESRRRPPEASLRWPHERRIVRCPGPPAASGAERSSRSTSHWRSSTSFLVCSAAEIRSRSSQVNRLGRLLLRGGIEVKTKKAAF